MTIRTSLLTLAVVATTGLVPATAVPDVRDVAVAVTASEPVYSYPGAVREAVWVDTGLTAPDGQRVRVAADVIRPSDAPGRVPVIMDASPYYLSLGRGNESQRKTYDSAGRPTSFPLFLDNYFVPRGYAVVQVDLAGTGRSTGCVDVGGPADITSAKAVVDWLNGRAAGYSAATGGTPVPASWSTGAVGMIGKSWDGTVANGVAATGVAGLRTIVPIAAISSWYDYYRATGATFPAGDPAGLARVVENARGAAGCASVKSALTAGAPASGDLTPMWRARDYVAGAANVRASVFAVHGLNDLNVKALNFGQWWSALPASVERKVWLSQTGHVDPFDFRRAAWVDALHRWFDHYLLGLDNGVQDEPRSTVETAPDVWRDDPAWPVPTTPTTLRPTPGTTAGVGTLGTPTPASGTTASFTDNRSDEYTWITNPTATSSARVLYRTAPLATEARISGTPSITITATPSTTAARLTAVLVDYGPTTTRAARDPGEGIANLTTRSCWGPTTPADSSCYLDTRTTTTTSQQTVIARGWADLGHHAGLDSRRTLTPGTPYAITFPLATTDYTLKPGHRLALVIGSTDSPYITPAGTNPRLAVDLGKTSLRLPLQGSV
ncbi:Xaa-Pro dipeptidyl-peptidase [Actinokineospora sp. PR83]|uniref:Xaa-Pro dipeptidyl-peptidase n=1 Tax=Actinokineospora sp. PR83 TaxID=2884908 RepID=UPI001F20CB4E|nr:Xaa-Pro dipeptidyl-peptidase [Actinokineospora sp. PR83]MCG8919389.1 Xaa-Pro dipeptidyl-peptidase [Actinokineospora sp. PR83]